MNLATGTVLQRYTIERTLGAGGMAVVYLARHNQIGSLHAIKVLSMHGPAIRERLLQEGRVQAGLRHPNIVTVTDLVEVDGAPALVLEYVRGPTLAALLRATRPSLAQIDAIARGMLRGVAAAHKQGLIHRDLKPGNVMLSLGGEGLEPKITDFGLGKLLRSEAAGTATRSGATMGTPAYMAPEQIRDSAAVDERADVFSLGAILYELVTGAMAFDGADTLDIFERVARGRYDPVEERAPDAPERMKLAIRKALQVERDERPAHAAALLELWTGQSEGMVEPISEVDLWSPEILEIADGLAPSAAESLDSDRPVVSAVTPDTFAISLAAAPSVPEPEPTPRSGDAIDPIPWGHLLRWTLIGPILAVPFAAGGVVAAVGSLGGVAEAGWVAGVLFALTLAGGGVLSALGVLWCTGRVSRHIWWLVVPALITTVGNLGTEVGARLAFEQASAGSLQDFAAIATIGSGEALHIELISMTLTSLLLLVTAEVAAVLVVIRRGPGRLDAPRRVAALVLSVAIGAVLWAATTLWITEGAVPFVVFLILVGAGFSSAAVSYETPDPDERTSEARVLAVIAGATGVLCAAKVVWLQDVVNMLAMVDTTQGVAAAEQFSQAVGASGVGLVSAWGAAAAVVALLAISGPGRPRLRPKTTVLDVVPLLLLLAPLALSKAAADREVGRLTGEVVPAYLGAEVHRTLGLSLTDRELMAHRVQVPGVLDPAWRMLERVEGGLHGTAEFPEGAVVVDPGRTALREADVILAVDGRRVASVPALLRELAACDCTEVSFTVDRGGELVDLGAEVSR